MPAFVLCTVLAILHLPSILCVEYTNGDISSPFTLYKNDKILSYNSLVRLSMQDDGNLVMDTRVSTSSSEWNSAGWSTNVHGDHVTLQSDGTLGVIDGSQVIWTSNSITGIAPFRLIVSDDIAVYILDSSKSVIWSTNPSFSTLQTIWFDTFDSNNGWTFRNDVTLPSPSTNCPNYPDNCLKLMSSSDGSDSWVIRETVVLMYSAIQFQVDITGYGLEASDDDYCTIYWKFDGGSWIQYGTFYVNAIYKDVMIDIPLPTSYTLFSISLEVYGTGNDKCFYDNAILRGINREDIIWYDLMDNNDNGDWAVTNLVTFDSYPECPVGSCAFVRVDGVSRIERVTDVSGYIDISLKVDLVADNLEDSGDACRVTWRYDDESFADNQNDYTVDGTYNDQVFSIADPGTRTLLGIRLIARGTSSSGNDKCYWDNVILTGTLVTDDPTNQPTPSPTNLPTESPTNVVTPPPTQYPTPSPTNIPTQSPIDEPTQSPSKKSTSSPTKKPTLSPTKNPTNLPTLCPNTNPTVVGTDNPTTSPIFNPTTSPIFNPTTSPIFNPTTSPMFNPTTSPITTAPSNNPTIKDPTNNPIPSPTASPVTVTTNPTLAPTPLCNEMSVSVILEDKKVKGVDFNDLYILDLNQRPFDRPKWNSVDGLSIEYNTDEWIINGVNGKTLSYVTDHHFPPVSIADAIWSSSEEKNPLDSSKFKKVLLICTDSYSPTNKQTSSPANDPLISAVTSREDHTVSVTSYPSIGITQSITSNPRATHIDNTVSAENKEGNTDVVTIVIETIVIASIAMCTCCIILIICNRCRQRRASKKHLSIAKKNMRIASVSYEEPQTQYQEQSIPHAQHTNIHNLEGNIMDFKLPPPPVPVNLEISYETKGVVKGNEAVIPTPNGVNPNIAPDEFVVVGDDEDDQVIDDALYVTAFGAPM